MQDRAAFRTGLPAHLLHYTKWFFTCFQSHWLDQATSQVCQLAWKDILCLFGLSYINRIPIFLFAQLSKSPNNIIFACLIMGCVLSVSSVTLLGLNKMSTKTSKKQKLGKHSVNPQKIVQTKPNMTNPNDNPTKQQNKLNLTKQNLM